MIRINYYEILGVSAKATQEEIKSAYRNHAKKHHPDVGGDPIYFKQIKNAYENLANTDSRKAYDKFYNFHHEDDNTDKTKQNYNNQKTRETSYSEPKNHDQKKSNKSGTYFDSEVRMNNYQNQKSSKGMRNIFLAIIIIPILFQLFSSSNASEQSSIPKPVPPSNTQPQPPANANSIADTNISDTREVDLSSIKLIINDVNHSGYYVYGRITNSSNHNITAKLDLVYYDSSDRIVGNDTTYVYSLRGKESQIFEAPTFIDKSTYNIIEITAVATSVNTLSSYDSNNYNAVRISISDLNYSDNTVYGKVTNQSNKKINVGVEIVFYNKSDRIVGRETTTIYGIEPNESNVFKVYTFADPYSFTWYEATAIVTDVL